MDNFQNVSNNPVIPSLWLVLTSSDTNVITIGPNNQLIAMGSGTATITASYLGQTTSQVIIVSPANLQISLSGTNAVICWPSNSATLLSALDLRSPGNWSAWTNSITSTGGTNTLLVPLTNSARFFRLH